MNLAQLSANENTYQPSASVREQLNEVSLVCIVGGAGVGKNYLMKASGIPVVGRVTSRPPRPDDDPKVYKYFSNEAIIQMIEQGVLAQYAVDLDNDVIYGSLLSDYATNKPVLMDTWSWSVSMLKGKGFGSVRAVSIVTPWEQWQAQFIERFSERDDSYKKARLIEAKMSLKWTLAQLDSPDHLVIVNDSANTERSVRNLRDFAAGKTVATSPGAKKLIRSLIRSLGEV